MTVLYKKSVMCTNCGKLNHEYKQCRHPITSWGIILVQTSNLEYFKHNNEVDLNKQVKSLGGNDTQVPTNIKFLMISRKNSLGYIEFIRGRYKPHMTDQTIYLFKQMKQSEIDKIRCSLNMTDGFEYLWNELWGDSHDTMYMMREKIDSRKKYEEMKETQINLENIVNTIKPDHDIDEWGFPKGRRNRNETEKECAVREFKEESGYNDDDFRVIDEIQPISETFIGTNGIQYRHVYYIAEHISQKNPENNVTEQQKKEVGCIAFFDLKNALAIIREYHVERKNILNNLFIYYMKHINGNHRKVAGISNI